MALPEERLETSAANLSLCFSNAKDCCGTATSQTPVTPAAFSPALRVKHGGKQGQRSAGASCASRGSWPGCQPNSSFRPSSWWQLSPGEVFTLHRFTQWIYGHRIISRLLHKYCKDFFPNKLKKQMWKHSFGFPKIKLLSWVHQEQNHHGKRCPFHSY